MVLKDLGRILKFQKTKIMVMVINRCTYLKRKLCVKQKCKHTVSLDPSLKRVNMYQLGWCTHTYVASLIASTVSLPVELGVTNQPINSGEIMMNRVCIYWGVRLFGCAPIGVGVYWGVHLLRCAPIACV